MKIISCTWVFTKILQIDLHLWRKDRERERKKKRGGEKERKREGESRRNLLIYPKFTSASGYPCRYYMVIYPNPYMLVFPKLKSASR